MRPLLTIAATIAILLIALAPTALAADPARTSGSVLLGVETDLDVPAGRHVDAVFVFDGNARISGDVDLVLVAGGTATLTGATAESVVVIDGSATLDATTVVTGDVRTLRGTVAAQPGAMIRGSVTALETDAAAFALLMIPVAIVLFLGLAIAAVVAALVVAAFGSRQVREMERLISTQPGPVLVTGVVGTVALPLLSMLAIMTVVGAPVGFALLFLVLPVLAFVAWLVAAIWIGDWLVTSMRGEREPGRPYLAAVLGVITLAIVGMLPFVTAIATLFGFGALVLSAWRTLRPQGPAPQPATATAWPAPSAG